MNAHHLKRDRLLLLHRVLTRKRINKILQVDPSLALPFHQTPSHLSKTLQLSPEKTMKVYHYLHHEPFKQQIEKDKRNFHVITIYDETYPTLLRHIPDPPFVLYGLGDVSLLQHLPSISMIGTRKPSNHAAEKLAKIASPLIKKNWLIVSGMAYGIDSLSHSFTLQQGGKTIAVLGGGLQHVYPRQHLDLFQQMTKEGLVISEYPPDMKPRRYHFPERNRIISGLSLATLVVEATERSGTFITVDQALEQGREVYAIPDSPLIKESQGCLTLIKEGAKLASDASDIMEDWETVFF